MKALLPLLAVLLPAIALAEAGAGNPSAMDIATADLRARAAYAHAQVDIAKKYIVTHPAATRPVLRSRDGRIAPDPRPTPQAAVTAAAKLADNADTAVSNALGNLRAVPTDKDKEAFPKALTIARLQINEYVDLALRALVETEYVPPRPSWLGGAPTQLGPVTSAQLDKDLSDVVFAAWQEQHPDNTGGLGVVGVGGKESMHAFTSGEKIGTLALVISPRISFRVNPALGKKSPTPAVTPTSPNFTLQLLRAITLDNTTAPEKSLLVRRASVWFTQPCPPDMSAAAPPITATKPAK